MFRRARRKRDREPHGTSVETRRRRFAPPPLTAALRRGAGLASWLAGVATLVLLADIALWSVAGDPTSSVWLPYGVAVVTLSLLLAGVIAVSLRRLGTQGRDSSVATLRVWVSRRRFSEERVSRRLLDASVFYKQLRLEVHRSMVYGYSLGVVIMRVNQRTALDAEGQSLVQSHIASLARRRMRSSDVVGQLGPDEFALYLPETDRRGALAARERLASTLEGLELAALGVAMFPQDGGSAEELVEAARQQATPLTTDKAA